MHLEQQVGATRGGLADNTPNLMDAAAHDRGCYTRKTLRSEGKSTPSPRDIIVLTPTQRRRTTIRYVYARK